MKQVWVELVWSDGGVNITRIFRNTKDAFAAYRKGSTMVSTDRSAAVACIRRGVFLRSNGVCEICSTPISEESGHMHEKKHRGQGGEISLDNSVFICPKCHQRQHKDRNPRWSKKP